MKDDFEKVSPREHNLRATFLIAAENGAIEMARDILYQGVLNAETLERALSAAATECQTGFIDFLINEVNMDLTHKGPEVLAQAVRDRDLKVVEMLTRDGRIPLNPQGAMETHYIDLALVGNNPYSPEVLQLLLDRGAKPVQAGFDSLNTAIRENNGDALQKFIKLDPALKRQLGIKLEWAAMRLDPAAVGMLLKNGAPANFEDSAPLRRLVQALNDVPGRDPARIYACAELLLAAGATHEKSEKELMKAAVRHAKDSILRLLLDRDVDVEPEVRGIGYNKMVLAATFGWEDLVEKYHLEGLQRPEVYEECLAAAAEFGHVRILDRLLEMGADATKTDIVFCAICGGQTKLVKNLTARGYTTDFKEKVLLDAVIENDHGAMLDLLFDNGADRGKAHEIYVKVSNRDRKPYAEIHATIKQWSERSLTVVNAIPDVQALADLRQTENDYRGHPETLLVRMSKINRFDEVVALARQTRNDRLEVADLLATDGAGNSVIEILGARGALGRLFTADLWKDRQQDFATLYAEVAPVYREQVDYQGLVSTWRQQALAHIKDKIPRLKRG